jgi:hypothetical protein
MRNSPESAAIRPRFGGLYRSVIINVGLPFVTLQWLLRTGTPAVTALAIAAIFPLAEAIFTLVRNRRFDPIALLSLIAIVAGLATSALSGNAAFLLAKESVFTGVFGAVFLGSLAAPRPLIFTLGKQFSTARDPAAMAAWETRWEARPGFRRVVRIMTVVWGAGLLLEAVVRVGVAFTLPVVIASVVSTALQAVVLGSLIFWTAAYVRVAQRRVATAEAAAGT